MDAFQAPSASTFPASGPCRQIVPNRSENPTRAARVCQANEPPPYELTMSQVLACWTRSGVARWTRELPGALPYKR